jgi:hypothetical protein
VNEGRVTYVRSFGGRLNTPEIGLDDLIPATAPGTEIAAADQRQRISLTSAIAGPVAGSHLTQLRDTLSLNRGHHSIRVGGEYSYEAITHDTTLNNYGVFTFDGTKTGNAFADFLTGGLRRFSQDAPVRKTDIGWYLGLFVQDDYRRFRG